jgi:hypothetical protein
VDVNPAIVRFCENESGLSAQTVCDIQIEMILVSVHGLNTELCVVGKPFHPDNIFVGILVQIYPGLFSRGNIDDADPDHRICGSGFRVPLLDEFCIIRPVVQEIGDSHRRFIGLKESDGCRIR